MNGYRPFIVGLGGALHSGSSNEVGLRIALTAARDAGAETEIVTGPDLQLPFYALNPSERTEQASKLVSLLRRADGIIIATPSYHGGMSGLIKNALDYTEDMREDKRPYFERRAVGCIVCAGGAQGASAAISGMRSMVHALRGWPTPYAAAIDMSSRPFDRNGRCIDDRVADSLSLVGRQVVEFARLAMTANPSARHVLCVG